MQTFGDLFDKFDGPARVGQAIGVSTIHAANMKRRGSIPPRYWPRLVQAATERGISEVTADKLAELAAARAERAA